VENYSFWGKQGQEFTLLVGCVYIVSLHVIPVSRTSQKFIRRSCNSLDQILFLLSLLGFKLGAGRRWREIFGMRKFEREEMLLLLIVAADVYGREIGNAIYHMHIHVQLLMDCSEFLVIIEG
jgi:hypothetical protein